MNFILIQCLNGLAHATTLFLMAAGLTLIFGVTRIVNFAHGGFFMLGAVFSAHLLVDIWPALSASAAGYLACMLLGALAAAAVGALAERLLLRRLYGVPELYQLVATFGLSLSLHDAILAVFGPGEVFAPRFPGLKGALSWQGEYVPVYSLMLMVLGPLLWAGLHLLMTRTRWGQQVRAATHDRAMLDALGVDPRPLMLTVVTLGCALAGLGGALQLPREPANLQMDMNVVVETFVVVVTGGLGSIAGAFWASVLIGLMHALGLSLWPEGSLVLVFLTMALVLVLRPNGLLGRAMPPLARDQAQVFQADWRANLWPGLLLCALGAWALAAGAFAQSVLCDALILGLFAMSLQSMMALGGMVSFGHAAFLALGAYAAALSHLRWDWSLLPALAAGVLLASAVAALIGPLLVQRSGVYLAMLSLAVAQVIWATASQWTALTGGDNGLIGLHLIEPEQRRLFLGGLLALVALVAAALRILSQSSLGAAAQALRDAPERAQASGLPWTRVRLRLFVRAAALAGLAGGLLAAHKGAVFPSVASVGTSVDALLALLLGGMHQWLGALFGAAWLSGITAELGGLVYWRGLLGLCVMLIMVLAPSGVLGLWRRRSHA